MSRFNRYLTITTIATGIMLGTTPMSVRASESSVTCSSHDYRYNYCRIETHGGVRLDRQLSNSTCDYKKDWGYDNDGVWVDNGCKATFLVGSKYKKGGGGDTALIVGGAVAAVAIAALLAGGSDSSDSNKQGETKEITCGSSDGEYNRCDVDTGNGVLLRRQLSEAGCWQGDTWGYDDNAIWVDKGCRAVFIVNSSS